MGSHANAPTASRLWRSIDPRDLIWNGWTDEYVVFHRPSGRTHFLNAPSALLVRELLAEPRSTEDVVRSFPPPDQPAESRAYHDEIASLLERLEHLGLILRA